MEKSLSNGFYSARKSTANGFYSADLLRKTHCVSATCEHTPIAASAHKGCSPDYFTLHPLLFRLNTLIVSKVSKVSVRFVFYQFAERFNLQWEKWSNYSSIDGPLWWNPKPKIAISSHALACHRVKHLILPPLRQTVHNPPALHEQISHARDSH